MNNLADLNDSIQEIHVDNLTNQTDLLKKLELLIQVHPEKQKEVEISDEERPELTKQLAIVLQKGSQYGSTEFIRDPVKSAMRLVWLSQDTNKWDEIRLYAMWRIGMNLLEVQLIASIHKREGGWTLWVAKFTTLTFADASKCITVAKNKAKLVERYGEKWFETDVKEALDYCQSQVGNEGPWQKLIQTEAGYKKFVKPLDDKAAQKLAESMLKKTRKATSEIALLEARMKTSKANFSKDFVEDMKNLHNKKFTFSVFENFVLKLEQEVQNHSSEVIRKIIQLDDVSTHRLLSSSNIEVASSFRQELENVLSEGIRENPIPKPYDPESSPVSLPANIGRTREEQVFYHRGRSPSVRVMTLVIVTSEEKANYKARDYEVGTQLLCQNERKLWEVKKVGRGYGWVKVDYESPDEDDDYEDNYDDLSDHVPNEDEDGDVAI